MSGGVSAAAGLESATFPATSQVVEAVLAVVKMAVAAIVAVASRIRGSDSCGGSILFYSIGGTVVAESPSTAVPAELTQTCSECGGSSNRCGTLAADDDGGGSGRSVFVAVVAVALAKAVLFVGYASCSVYYDYYVSRLAVIHGMLMLSMR